MICFSFSYFEMSPLRLPLPSSSLGYYYLSSCLFFAKSCPIFQCGKTARDYAVERGHTAVVALLDAQVQVPYPPTVKSELASHTH
jgi:hypothetical protein